MTPAETELLTAFELHSVERLRTLLDSLDSGFDPLTTVRGKTPVDWLLEMYTRSDAFPACLRLLLDRGATLGDPRLAPVLLDDGPALDDALDADPTLLTHRTTLVSTFTPLGDASLLHVAAEYGNLQAARVLVERGADLEARAGLDEDGLGGHTPLFHTVNSNAHRSAPVMRLLLAAGARADARVAGLTWGRGFEWETTFFDLTPLSYAQLGLLPQMHRREEDITDTVRLLLAASTRPVPPLANVPNRYLRPRD